MSLPPPSVTDLRCLLRCDDDAQKCDAKQPCTPCSNGGRSDCVYEQSRVKPRTREEPPAPAEVHPFSSKDEKDPCRSPSPWVNSQVSSLPAPSIAPPESEPPAPREGTIPKLKLVPIQEPHRRLLPAVTPTPSVLPPLRLLTIPRRLHTSLSFLGPERFQVSDTTSSELDMALWVHSFLGRRAQASQELTSFVQPPCCPTAIEAVWDLSSRAQAGCCIAWRRLEHGCQSLLHPRLGWARDVFLCRCRTLTHNGFAACETRSAGF